MKIMKFLCSLMLIAATGPVSAGIADHAVRGAAAGIEVIVYPMGVKDVVTLKGYFPGGSAFAANRNPMLAGMVSSLLNEGTTKQDKFAIARKLGEVGAMIGFGSDKHLVYINAKCLKQDLPLVVALMAEQLRHPAFSAEDFAKAKTQFNAELKQYLDDPGAQAASAFGRSIFPIGHPNRQAAIPEMLKAVDEMTLDDVKDFYRQYYGPAHMVMIAAGDIDMPRLKSELNKAFAGWKGGADAVRDTSAAAPPAEREQTIPLPGKASISVIIGQASGLRYRDPDFQALRMGTNIFGTGFTGRLMSTIRDQEGLTYGIYAAMGEDTLATGSWYISGNFAPGLLDKGIASTRRELLKWWREGVTEQELAEYKTNLIGMLQLEMATTDGMAGMLMTTLQRGYDIGFLDRFPAMISAITREQVNGAIKKYLDPEKMVTIKAGAVQQGS